MAQRRDLPYKALRTMEAVALGQFDAMLERGQAIIESQILESSPDLEEITAAEVSDVLSKSAGALNSPFSQEVLHSYAFGVPKELELAAIEARGRSLDDFVALASGLPSSQEMEAVKVAEHREKQRAGLWVDFYSLYREEGMGIDRARQVVEANIVYIRARDISEVALIVKERTQKVWEEMRSNFLAKWEAGIAVASAKGIGIPEGPDQLVLFWSVANNR